MEVAGINCDRNINLYNNKKFNTNVYNGNNIYSPSFGNSGFQTSVVALMDLIEMGGMAASFTIQDMIGTNIPRTTIALNRNKEELGHLNYQHGAEVALREFITGPSLFLIPLMVLSIGKKAFGTALNVHMNAINSFGNILSQSVKNNNSSQHDIKKIFYTNVFKEVISNTGETDNVDEIADKMAKILLDSETAKNCPFFKRIKEGNDTKYKSGKINNIYETFIDINKKNCDNPTANFSNAILDKGKNYTLEFKKMISQMQDFINDASKHIEKNSKLENFNLENYIKTFTKNRKIGRGIINALMIACMTGFCMALPKLYSLSDSNPAVDGLVGENIVPTYDNNLEGSEVDCEA